MDAVLGDGAKLDAVAAPSVVLTDASWRGRRDVHGHWGASLGAVQLQLGVAILGARDVRAGSERHGWLRCGAARHQWCGRGGWLRP